MPALTSTSVKGSTAVEFSGQTTRSGRGARPASTSAARSSVRATWLAVISRCTAGTSVPSPGTSPCTAATVKPPSPRLLTPGTASYDPTSGSRVTTAIAAGGRHGDHGPPQAAGHQPRQRRAGERDQQADARSCRATGRPAATPCRRSRRSADPRAAPRRARRRATSRPRPRHRPPTPATPAAGSPAPGPCPGARGRGPGRRSAPPTRPCPPRASTTAGSP